MYKYSVNFIWIAILSLSVIYCSNKAFAIEPIVTTIDDFHREPEVKKPKEKPKETKKHPVAKEDIYYPFFFNHSRVAVHSIKYIANGNQSWINLNLQLTAHEYKKVPVLEKYVSALSLLDPKVEAGYSTTLDRSKRNFYLGVIAGLKRPKNGVVFKTTVFSDKVEDLAHSTYGVAAAYYYHDVLNLYSASDLASFYAGWVSPRLDVDLKNLEAFRANFKDLKQHYKSLVFGFHYWYDVAKKISVNGEVSSHQMSMSVNYLF